MAWTLVIYVNKPNLNSTWAYEYFTIELVRVVVFSRRWKGARDAVTVEISHYTRYMKQEVRN